MTEAEWMQSENMAAMLYWFTSQASGPDAWRASRGVGISPRKLRLFACACCRAVWDKLTDDAPCPNCHDGFITTHDHTWPCSFCHGSGRVNRSRRAVLVAERYADGEATGEELTTFRGNAHYLGNTGGTNSSWYLASQPDPWHFWPVSPMPSLALQAHILRDVAGNPWRPVTLTNVRVGGNMGLPTPRCPWLTPTVFALAQACYLERGRVCEHCTGPGGENLAYTGKIQGKPCPKCGRLPPPFGNDPPAGDGTLDNDRLAVLSDALLEAGCHVGRVHEYNDGGVAYWWNDAFPDDRHLTPDRAAIHPIVEHLRSPGPHVRGCWVLDLLLGKT